MNILLGAYAALPPPTDLKFDDEQIERFYRALRESTFVGGLEIPFYGYRSLTDVHERLVA